MFKYFSHYKKSLTFGDKIFSFYGSQTSTDEEFASRLTKEAVRYGMKALIADPEEYELVMTPLIAYLIILRRRTNQIK